MKNNLLALKPYLESLTERCSRLSTEELLGIILGLAKEVPAKQRVEFLAKIGRLSQGQMTVVGVEDVLQQIEALKQDIRGRIASIEDGSYYEEYREDYNGWDYDDAGPEPLSEEQEEELLGFFEDAAHFFLSGQLEPARKVYDSLFRFLDCSDVEEGYDSSGIPDHSLDMEMREARARYCRCVYETTPLPRRVAELLAAMNVHALLSDYSFDVYDNDHPMLLDVMNSRPGELADREKFLFGWKDALGRITSDRADLLLLEAGYLLEGLGGIESLVRSWGSRQPRGWLFWIQALESAEDRPGAAAAAEEALSVLAPGHFRALTAEQLIQAGEKMDRADLVLRGKREVFVSLPNDRPLLRLIEEAERQNVRASEIEKALEHLCSIEKEEKFLLVKALLMAGKIEAAFEKAKQSLALGWSYGDSAGAVLFGSILSAICLDRIEEAATIRRVLRRHADADHGRFAVFEIAEEDQEDRDNKNIRMSDEILAGLRNAVISGEQEKKYLVWAESIGRKRIEQIVSSQHRTAYDRAAEVLGALAECFLLKGEKEKSRMIVEEYRNQRFSRHSAFRRQVDSVMSASRLLRRIST